MRLHEITENVSTTTAAIATVAKPMGTISRMGGNLLSGKYAMKNAAPVMAAKPRKKRAQ
jgi:hypothetical protein